MWFMETAAAATARVRMNLIIQVKKKQNPHILPIHNKKIKS